MTLDKMFVKKKALLEERAESDTAYKEELDELEEEIDAELSSLGYRRANTGTIRKGRNRKAVFNPASLKEAQDLIDSGWTLADVARHFGVTPASLHHHKKQGNLHW